MKWLVFLAVVACTAPQTAEMDIQAALLRQQEAWNRGDLPGFMEPYWKSPDLMFIGKSGITRGWDSTLARYQRSYPNHNAMGQLEFKTLQLDCGETAAWHLGQWTLYRSADTLSGYFTLLWKKRDGQWVIVADHSS
jgi:hypothetical protein